MPEAEQKLPETALKGSQMGLASRLFNFFLGSPSAAVQSLREKARWSDWVVPILVTFVVTAAVGHLTRDIMINEVKDRISSSPRLSQEQVDTMLKRINEQQEKWRSPGRQILGYAISLVFMTVLTAIVGGVVLFIVNVLLGGETRFVHAFALAAWGGWLVHMQMVTGGFLIGLFPAVVKTPMMLAKQSTEVATSIAILLPESMKNQFLYIFLNKIDIFNIWLLAIMSIGVGVLARVSTKRAAVWVVGIWLLLAFIGSVISSFLIKLQGFA